MKKFAFNRKNRDRRGGHQNTELSDGVFYKEAGRKFVKHVFAKTARRQHRRITAEAVQEWEEFGTRLAFRGSRIFTYEDCKVPFDPNNPNFVWFDPLSRIPEVEDREEWDEYRSEYGDMKRPENLGEQNEYREEEYDDVWLSQLEWGKYEDPWDAHGNDALQVRLDNIKEDVAAREVLNRLGEGRLDVEQALDEIRFIFKNRQSKLEAAIYEAFTGKAI